MLLHQFIRTSRVVINSNFGMRRPLLRKICRDLDTRKDLLRRFLGVAIEGSRR